MNTRQIAARLQMLSRETADDETTYRPRLFRLAQREDREKLVAVFDKNRDIHVHDQLAQQLRALIETRNPQETLKLDDLNDLVKQHLDGQPPAEYGVWAHYPWSRDLVHLLDKDEFVELRTSRNCYKITREEQDALAGKIVGIIGLSVGQSVAVTMAIERSYGEIRLADYDTLELTNLNRLRSGVQHLGLSKVILAAREIAEIDPFLRVRCFTEGLSEDNLDRFLLKGGKLSLLIDECDGLDIKFLCRRRARELRIPVVMDTSDRGMIDVERFDLEPDRPIFHGLVPEPSPSELRGLSTDEKVPFVLSILGRDTLSKRLRASMLEVGNSIPTWPQLATSVALGGAVAGDVCRRILLESLRDSGRYYVDLEQLVCDPQEPPVTHEPSQKDQAPEHNNGSNELTQPLMERLADEGLRLGVSRGIRLERDRIEQIARVATLAPSAGNAQPWRWMYRETCLWLFHDGSRSMQLDFEDQASYLAFGAAAENLILEAHRQGLEVSTVRFPLPNDRRLVAGFTFHDRSVQSKQAELHVRDDLVEFVRVRLTNRELGPRVKTDSTKLEPLVDAARTFPGANLNLFSSDERMTELGEIIAASDRLRLLHQKGHEDFIKEMRWTPEEVKQTRDGIDLDTVDLSKAERAGLELVRHWPVVEQLSQWRGGKGFESLTRKSVTAASAIGLIRMRNTDSRNLYFDAGRVVQRVWLEASRQELAFQPLSGILFLLARLAAQEKARLCDSISFSPPITAELSQLRDRFVKVVPPVSGCSDVFLFRLAIANPPSVRSLRRKLEDVLVVC